MPRIITYSLRLNGRTSDEYYRAIEKFADEWTSGVTVAMGGLIAGFRAWRRKSGQPDRTDAECAFELLALGVLLREHGVEAARMPDWSERALGCLVIAQHQRPSSASLFKTLRGWIGWLARRGSAWRARSDDVEHLMAWLRANGESARADRLTQWQEYFAAIGARPARTMIARCLALAAEFAAASALALGQYTEGVNRFLAEAAPKHRFRYDAEFSSRSRIEYHLGLLGTEVLSRAYRARFRSARRKIVIVPPCLRAQPEEKCKATETYFGAKCQACTPTCRVHQITKLGEKRGFDVFMIPDELRVFKPGLGVGKVGVVGVSCALTNWSGGWEADTLGVAAQGVLLDYVGCKYHWDEKGIPTDTNLKKLEEVVMAET
ncbi:MAG: DUF116 domain-containing protein [Chloroflexi bacterium]|nr:DUF116 domain-containing protein [Chloroflexota bacterium]